MSPSPVEPGAGESFNVVAVRGALVTEVRVSELSSGGVVHNFEMKTGVGADRHVVPVAWHDPSRPARLSIGDEVVVVGAVRRRWFRSGGGSQSRTEVLAATVAKAASRRAATALEAAAANLRETEVSRS